MPNPVYTLKEKQEWLKYHYQGESPEMISKHFHREHEDRPKPSKNTIKAAIKRFLDTGRFDRPGPYVQPKKAVPVDKRILACAAIEAEGGCVSAASVARQLGIAESTVRKIWKQEGFEDGSTKRISAHTRPRKTTKNSNSSIDVPGSMHWLAALNGYRNLSSNNNIINKHQQISSFVECDNQDDKKTTAGNVNNRKNGKK